ncbi:MAG: tetratricopeptide repeat protein [Gammaproteobacteria bacterium]|nr:tetratricopeptide repeat protein [Gammaproteobacteria bacterium]
MAKKLVLTSLLLGLLAACAAPEPVVSTRQYHQPLPPQQSPQKPLNGLQLEAFRLMNQQQYAQSINYFQRAIKIDPRSPHNWFYLALNYWHLQDFAQCRAMLQRSMSYNQFDEDLRNSSLSLLAQCSP